MMNRRCRLLSSTKPLKKQTVVVLIAVLWALARFSGMAALAQGASLPQIETSTIEGTVRSSTGELLVGASVRLEERELTNSAETKTKADGSFAFSGMGPGVYTVRAEKEGWHERVSNPLVLKARDRKRVDLVLESL